MLMGKVWTIKEVILAFFRHSSVSCTYPGLQKLLQPCSRAARKWRENEEMKRKWRENEEIERKWRENEEMDRE